MQRFFYMLLVTMVVFSASSLSQAALDDDIVFYLTFDNVQGKTIRDESDNGHDAEIIANAEFADGHIGKAIEITAEGADCVNIPAVDTLKITGEITMMAWVYQEAWSTDAQWFDKNCHNGGEKNSYGIGVFGAGANILMMLGETASRRNLQIPNEMEDGKWHHIVGTYDGTTMAIYLDGELLGDSDEGFKFEGNNDQDVRIGCAKDRPQYGFDGGLIDEAAVWRRALSEDEIQEAMRSDDLLAVYPQDKLTTTWGAIKRRE